MDEDLKKSYFSLYFRPTTSSLNVMEIAKSND